MKSTSNTWTFFIRIAIQVASQSGQSIQWGGVGMSITLNAKAKASICEQLWESISICNEIDPQNARAVKASTSQILESKRQP